MLFNLFNINHDKGKKLFAYCYNHQLLQIRTCLIAERLLFCGSWLRYRSAFSPPSPVLLLPPSLFIAIARVE